MNDPVFVRAKTHLTAKCFAPLIPHQASLFQPIRHQASGSEHGAQFTDHTHGVGGRDDHIKIEVTALNRFSKIVESDNICPCGSLALSP